MFIRKKLWGVKIKKIFQYSINFHVIITPKNFSYGKMLAVLGNNVYKQYPVDFHVIITPKHVYYGHMFEVLGFNNILF